MTGKSTPESPFTESAAPAASGVPGTGRRTPASCKLKPQNGRVGAPQAARYSGRAFNGESLDAKGILLRGFSPQTE